MNMILLTLQLSIPIVLGAMCGTIAERSGVILLGVEGMMLAGAFGGVLGAYITGNAWVGVLFSVVVGAVVGLGYGAFCLKFRAHQSVIGVGVNLLASGLTAVLLKVIWQKEGMSEMITPVANITVPGLHKLPIIGALFTNQSPYLYMMFAVVVGIALIYYKSKIGLRIRAIGDQPYAAQTAGIQVNRYRYVCLMLAGMIAGLAGSYLSISQNNLFVVDMVAGRGFMGLAANIFGGWTPLGSLGAGLVFALAQSGRFYLSEGGIPTQFVQMLPYIVTLIVLLFVGKKAKGPEALGKLVNEK